MGESDSYSPADLRTSNSLEKDLCNLLQDSEEMTQPYNTNTQSTADLNDSQIDTEAHVESEARAIDLLQNQLEKYEHLIENRKEEAEEMEKNHQNEMRVKQETIDNLNQKLGKENNAQ